MTTRGFGVHTPRELLTRAQFDVGELEQSMKAYFIVEKEGHHKVGSAAATCAGDLWNIVDWLANSTDSTTRNALAKAGFLDHKAIRDHVTANSSALLLCREITNGYKHCEIAGYTLKVSQIDKPVLSAPSTLPPDYTLAYRFVPKIKTMAGANLSALDIYKEALAFWENFFTQVGL